MQNLHQEDDLGSPFVAPFLWDDDDWKLWNAMIASRDQPPAVAPRLEAATAGSLALGVEDVQMTTITVAVITSPDTRSQNTTHPAPVVCHSIASVPPGRQPSAILQCGMCMDPHLYARKADLKRHMETHFPATHFCHVNGCNRGPGKGFTRVDKLHEHLKKIHGLQGSSSSNN